MKKLLVALVALLIAASPAFAEEAKELNVFSWSEYIPQEVVNGFTKETGIKVVLSTYESNEAMYAKLKLLGAKGYDLVVPSGYFVEVMAQDNRRKSSARPIRCWTRARSRASATLIPPR